MEEMEQTPSKPHQKKLISEQVAVTDLRTLYLLKYREVADTSEQEYNRQNDLMIIGNALLSEIKTAKFTMEEKTDFEKLQKDINDFKATPADPEISCSYENIGGARLKTIVISSEDGGRTQVEPEQYPVAYPQFRSQQFTNHTREARGINIRILQMLTRYGVLYAVNKSVDELIDEMTKQGIIDTQKQQREKKQSKETE